jgi:hypothetical protein
MEARLQGDRLSMRAEEQARYATQNVSLSQALSHFYTSQAWRKLQSMRFVSRQKRDASFLNLFVEYFGYPEDIVIVWGDAYKGQKTFKGHVPTNSGQYFKDLLIRRGYYVFDVSEYWTSQKCHKCGEFLMYAEGKNEAE